LSKENVTHDSSGPGTLAVNLQHAIKSLRQPTVKISWS